MALLNGTVLQRFLPGGARQHPPALVCQVTLTAKLVRTGRFKAKTSLPGNSGMGNEGK